MMMTICFCLQFSWLRVDSFKQEGVLVERLTTVANWKQNIMEDANDKGKALQTRLYYILEKLQVMAKEVPV